MRAMNPKQTKQIQTNGSNQNVVICSLREFENFASDRFSRKNDGEDWAIWIGWLITVMIGSMILISCVSHLTETAKRPSKNCPLKKIPPKSSITRNGQHCCSSLLREREPGSRLHQFLWLCEFSCLFFGVSWVRQSVWFSSWFCSMSGNSSPKDDTPVFLLRFRSPPHPYRWKNLKSDVLIGWFAFPLHFLTSSLLG